MSKAANRSDLVHTVSREVVTYWVSLTYRDKEARNQCCVVHDDDGLVHDLGHAFVTVVCEELYFPAHCLCIVLAGMLYSSWHSW